jgi:hypothetical protein
MQWSQPKHEAPLGPPIIFPSRELQSSLARRTKRSPPTRPKRPEELMIPPQMISPLGIPSPNQMGYDQFGSESFNQYLPPSFGPAPIPPRRSSKRVPPQLKEHSTQTFFRDSITQDDLDRYPDFALNRPSSQGLSAEPLYQRPQISPIFNAPLEQVPEEPEGTASPRMSKQLRHAKSSPNMSRTGSKTALMEPLPPFTKCPPKERPSSAGSDTLGDLGRRSFSINEITDCFRPMRATVSSWEEDVEYCYEHSAEANCDFDWNNVSRFLDTDSSDGQVSDQNSEPRGSLQSSHSEMMDLQNKSFLHYSYVEESTPELDYRSAYTGSTNSLAIGTPQDKQRFTSMETRQSVKSSQRKAEVLLGITIPQSSPMEMRHNLDSDELYEELMGSYIGPEKQSLPILEPKVYSRDTTPTLRQKQFDPVSPGPTSAPSEPRSGSLLSPSLSPSKTLPPLPSPAEKPLLSLGSMIAQLRTPKDTPSTFEPFDYIPVTPPASTKSSPPISDFKIPIPTMKRKALRFGRSGNDSIGYNSPPSPPETPLRQSPSGSQLEFGSFRSRSRSTASNEIPHKPLPPSPSVLKKQPSMPNLRPGLPKRVEFTSYGAFQPNIHSPTGSDSSKSAYSLYPPMPRPRRSTDV